LGREHQRTRKGTQAVEAGEVFTTDATTLYLVLGDWVGWLSLVATLGLVGAAWGRKP